MDMSDQVDDVRQASRVRVLLKAVIYDPDGAQQVRLKDLSDDGVQIFCEKPPAADSDVIFKRGAVFAAARVAWANRTSAGLQFYRPFARRPGPL